MTKSMIIVVPPASPAAVPVKKSSLATVPMNGSCMCVCGSMPPGITYWPPASTTSRFGGRVEFVADLRRSCRPRTTRRRVRLIGRDDGAALDEYRHGEPQLASLRLISDNR